MSGQVSFRKNSDTFFIYNRLKQGSASLDELVEYMQTINQNITRDTIRGRLSYLKTHGICYKQNGEFNAV